MKRKTAVQTLTKKYREELILKDFQGRLNESEIPIARENGLLKWDLFCKSKRLDILPVEWMQKSFSHLAPVHGKVHYDQMGNVMESPRFYIPDYSTLERRQKEKK